MSVLPVIFLLLVSLSSFSLPLYASLPAFASDFSEVAISAIIERSGHDANGGVHTNTMHLALFLIGRKALVYLPQMPFLAMNNSKSDTSKKWGRVAAKWNEDMKARQNCTDKFPVQQALDCRFQSSSDLFPREQRPIKAQGVYIPSNTSEDGGFNRMIEVLRCQINATLVPQEKHGREKLHVDIISPKSGSVLFRFYIPWRTRQIGYGFRHSKISSSFDPWRKPYARHFPNETAASSSPLPSVHLCSPIIRPLEPHRKDPGLPALLEFVEHNVLIGVDHQFLGVFLDPRSKAFQQVLRLLSFYIQSGKVSITSMALKGFDDASGFLGVMLIDDYARIIHNQQCLYFSKGVADYVYIAHATEFLTIRKYPLPLLTYYGQDSYQGSTETTQLPNLLHYIEEMERSRVEDQKSCVHVIQAFGVPDPSNVKRKGPDNNYFLTDYYKDSIPVGPLPAWVVLLVPTRRVWLVAWHVVGACGLPLTPSETFQNYPYRDITKPISKKIGNGSDVNTLNIDDVVSYFYRGHFEPWQMARRKQPNNYHLDIYKEILRYRLSRLRGYSSAEMVLNSSVGHAVNFRRRKPRFQSWPVGKKALISSGWRECSHPCRNFMDLLLFTGSNAS